MNIKVAFGQEQWPNTLRRASLNSFGYGGANAHVILESVDSYLGKSTLTPRNLPAPSSGPRIQENLILLPISAASNVSLQARTEQITKKVRATDAEGLQRMAYTLSERATHLKLRSYCLASTVFNKDSGGVQTELTSRGDVCEAHPLPFAFLFTGQGAQYATMGRALLDRNLIFQTTICGLDKVLQELPTQYAPNWTLEGTILDSPETSKIHDVTRSQPLCTAIQVGLVNVLRSWGIKPSAIIGHSSGEIAGAYAAGLHDSSEAILIAYFRGFAVSKLTTQGAMTAVGVGSHTAINLIKELGLSGQLWIACINSPEGVTISGSVGSMTELLKALQKRKILARKLETGNKAYHSPMMKEVGELYENLLSQYAIKEPRPQNTVATMYSSVGEPDDEDSNDVRVLNTSEVMCNYWRHNLEKPVHFSFAVSTCLDSGQNFHFVELGPHPALKGPFNQICKGANFGARPLYSPTLIRNEDADTSMKCLAGTLFSHGQKLHWPAVNTLPSQPLSPMDNPPVYPWDYSAGLRWFEPHASVEMRHRRYPRHELLGSQQTGGNGIDWRWRNTLQLNEIPWIRDHKVESQILFPAAGYLSMAIEAVSQVQDLRFITQPPQISFEFRKVSFSAALVLSDQDGGDVENVVLHTTMSLRSAPGSLYDFTISSRTATRAVVHCSGSLCVAKPVLLQETSVPIQNSACNRAWPMGPWYDKAKEEGFNFGSSFRSIETLYTDANRSHSRIVCSTPVEPVVSKDSTTYYPLHPIVIDACLQTATWSAAMGSLRKLRTFVPVSVSRCRIQPRRHSDEDAAASLHGVSQRTGSSTLRADCTARDLHGAVLMDWKDIRFLTYAGRGSMNSDLKGENTERHPALRVFWKPDIFRLGPHGSLDDYVSSAMDAALLSLDDNKELKFIVGVLLDLTGHQNPKMRILEVTDPAMRDSEKWMAILDRDTYFPRYRSWHAGAFDENGFSIPDCDMQVFDTIVHMVSTEIAELSCTR